MAVVERDIIAAGGGDYTTIAAWESATNLNSGADIWKGKITDNAAYDEAVVINGGGTGTTSYVWLTVDSANAHAGVWDTGKARLTYSGGNTAAIQIDSDFVRVDWLQIYRSTPGVSDEGIRIATDNTNDVLLDYLVCWTDSGTNDTDGVYAGAITVDCSVSNSVFYGWNRGSIHSQQSGSSDAHTINIDHCGLALNGDKSDEANLNVQMEATGPSVITAYNTWIGGQTGSAAGSDIRADDGGSGDVIDFDGSNNAFDSTSVTQVGSGTTNFNWTSNQDSSDGLVDTAPGTAGIYITETAGGSTFDATLVDHANNVCVTNGTNRQGSEPDARQDFSVAINGARGTTDVDIGPFQISGDTGATASPATIATVAALPASAVSITETPATVVATAALPAATAAISITASPAAITSTAAVGDLDVSVGAAPAAIAAMAALPVVADAGQAGTTVTPAAITATTAVGDLDVSVGAAPATLAATATVPTVASVGQGSATATPNAVAAVTTLGDVDVTVSATPAATAATVAVGDPDVTVSASPAVTAATVAVGDVDVSIGAAPAAIAGVATLPTVTSAGQGVSGAVTATPSAVAAVVTVEDADVTVSATPTTLAATTAMGLAIPQIAAGPSTIAATTTIGDVDVSVGVTPAVITVVTTLPTIAAVGELIVGPHPVTLTVRDRGHTATVRDTGHTTTEREQR